MEVLRLRREGIAAQRRKLSALRAKDAVDHDVFDALQRELDWAELAVSENRKLQYAEA